MAYTPVENREGIQPIAITNAALPSQYQVGQSPFFGQNHPLGTIIRAYDPTLGEGEFIYLIGAASTVVGSLVTYDNNNKSTTLAPSTANLDQPLAVAMSANVASQYGWYQIGGVAVVAKSLSVKTTTNHVPVYLAGSGQITFTAASGKQVLNATTVNSSSVASATTTVLVQINRPFAQGQVK